MSDKYEGLSNLPMSDTPRTSAWWREWFDSDSDVTYRESFKKMLSDLAAAERSDAIHLEALAESERMRSIDKLNLLESERLRVEAVDALNRANDATTRVEEQLRLATISEANAEAEANDLRAERDRLQHIIDCANTPLMRDVLADRASLLAVLRQAVEAMEMVEHTAPCDECGDKHCVVCGRQDCVVHKEDCKLGNALAAAKAKLEEA